MCFVNAGFSRNPLLQIGRELVRGQGGENGGVNTRCERTCVGPDVLC